VIDSGSNYRFPSRCDFVYNGRDMASRKGIPNSNQISIEKRKSQHQSTEYTLIKMGLIHKIEEKVLHHGDKKHAQQQYMYTVSYLF
jgi:hypothetical protein